MGKLKEWFFKGRIEKKPYGSPKITKIIGKYFYICNMGTRPRMCPLLKRNKKRGEK